jgi:glucokinase
MNQQTEQMGLVADIGGTNARFALAHRQSCGALSLDHRQDLAAEDYPTLALCLQAYLDGLEASQRPSQAAFGVACPITGDHVKLTNRDWSFSIEGLRQTFGLDRLEVVNDFTAIGHSIGALSAKDMESLPGPVWPEPLSGVVSIVGPGTGLGIGGRVLTKDGAEVILASEGGHVSFAPIDAMEIEILRCLLGKFPRISNERILSGPGLGHLYEALSEIRGAAKASPGAPAILEAAILGRDALAVEAVERFCLILGSVISDVALIHGASAVVIAGGMAPRMTSFLNTAAVRSRFEAKGRAQHLLSTLPIALIRHPQPGLLGAANLLIPAKP